MKGLASSLAIVTVFVVVLWAVGDGMGYHMSLSHSLLATVGLTVVLNLVLSIFRRH